MRHNNRDYVRTQGSYKRRALQVKIIKGSNVEIGAEYSV